MKAFTLLFVFVALAAIVSAHYLPKKEYVQQTPQEWTEIAKKLGWDDDQTAAVVDVMQFIQNKELTELDSNTELKEAMLAKCLNLSKYDKINELDNRVGDKKWKDMKNSDFTTKWEFWNNKYTTWTCEHGKMLALKNMCIVVTEDAKKKHYIDVSIKAGFKEAQLESIADMVWEMQATNSTGLRKSILADHCGMVNDDGVIFDVDETQIPSGEKWLDQEDKNITMKMDFWWRVLMETECRVTKFKTLKNICVLFMSPKEREEIEGWAKDAGLQEEDIKAAVDLEMRLRFVRGFDETRDLFRKDYKNLGKNKQVLKADLSPEEIADLAEDNFYKLRHFWGPKYYQSTGPDHIKYLKNCCVVYSQEKEQKKIKKETA